jgi:hypothetical protein
MNVNTKEITGSLILIVYLILGLWAGMEVLQSYGDALGSLFPAYLMVWVLVLFSGRFAIVWLLNKLWRP